MQSKKQEFYVVYSHYNKNGQKSRLVKQITGEVITYRGHPFGLYMDGNEGIWKLVDAKTGKMVASHTSRARILTRLNAITLAGFWEITEGKDYPLLEKEYKELITKSRAS